jgi:hypothetical protein
MTGRPTVEHVFDAACGFGQEDDITVVSITRTAVIEPQILVSLSPHLAPKEVSAKSKLRWESRDRFERITPVGWNEGRYPMLSTRSSGRWIQRPKKESCSPTCCGVLVVGLALLFLAPS